MDSFHVILGVPLAGKSFSRDAAITARKVAQDLHMTMHSMGFAFMSKETCGGRKGSFLAVRPLAPVGFQVRIQMFAVNISHVLYAIVGVLTRNCTLDGMAHFCISCPCLHKRSGTCRHVKPSTDKGHVSEPEHFLLRSHAENQ